MKTPYNATVIASLNGREVYRRPLVGFLSFDGIEDSISNSVKHDFSNYNCEVIREYRPNYTESFVRHFSANL